MKALVTGGAGFVGSCLASELLQDEHEVLVYDNLTTGSLDFLPQDHEGLIAVEGDIVDHERLLEVMVDWAPTVVFHLAAIHYIPYCNAHPMETMRVNVEGTQSVIEACRGAGVARIVAASSAAVYGISDEANRESDPPGPMDVYGASKLANEIQLRLFHEQTGTACLAARLFNVYGYNETNPHVIPAILDQIMGDGEIQLGNLEPARDFVYVRDVARALIALANAAEPGFGIFNVGTGQEWSIQELVRTCEGIFNKSLQIRSVASRRRATDRWHLLADISRIVETVGWQPQYDLREGLEETVEAMGMIAS